MLPLCTDWEVAADRAPDELLSPESLLEVSKLSLEDAQVQGLKRRGRGTFSYGRHGMYSDKQSNYPVIDDAEDKADSRSSTAENAKKDCKFMFAPFVNIACICVYSNSYLLLL